MNKNTWQNAAQASIGAGVIPIPVTDTLLELLQTIMNEKEDAVHSDIHQTDEFAGAEAENRSLR